MKSKQDAVCTQTAEETGMPEGCRAAEWDFKDYRLLKIGLTSYAIDLLQEESPLNWQKKLFRHRKRKIRKKKEKERSNLLDAVFRLWGDPCSSYCVCQDPITYFNKWRFDDYRESKWVVYLMRRAVLPHFIVLGNTPCLPEILFRYARGMKSLGLYLLEREYKEELKEGLEELFEEYGVAADIHFLREDSAYRKLPPLHALPCNVLDFSGEEKISPWAPPTGSIWIDFDSSEEKRRRIESRGEEVKYFSLIKEWKQPEKVGNPVQLP